MDYIHRKVFLTKNLVPHDSDGDGVMDSLVLSATTKNIQVPLRQSFDDIGIYEVSTEESFEIIDIAGFMDDTIDGGTITQPTTPPSVTGNTWNGGGTSQAVQQEVFYCDDTTALNYQVKSSGVRNGQNVFILTDVLGNETIYGQDANGLYPTLTVNNTLCTYSYTVDPGTETGGGTGPESGGGSGLVTLTGQGGCGQSWSNVYSYNYENTALANANAYCSTNYGSSTLSSSSFPSGYVQGDCNTAGTSVFSGVKLKSHTETWCCQNGDYSCGDNNDQCCGWVRQFEFTYCFYCS